MSVNNNTRTHTHIQYIINSFGADMRGLQSVKLTVAIDTDVILYQVYTQTHRHTDKHTHMHTHKFNTLFPTEQSCNPLTID